MIYVTQGHEKGIGLEVFFKSCLFFTQEELVHITLIAFKDSVAWTLKTLNIPFEINENSINFCHLKISTIWPKDFVFSQSFTALNLGMDLCEKSGVLYTLPTSKDQFPHFAGHTEYFRHIYKKTELGMFFSSPQMQMLLVTDHIPVSSLSQTLTEKRIYQSLENCYFSLNQWQWPFKNFLVSGINPHAGENGLIGSEDVRVIQAIKAIRAKYKIDIFGPYPGDTLLRETKSRLDVLVYLYHDQGLALFKGLNGLIGSNITLGLPYPRFSPDHGTSFNLFGKNEADYRGCQFSLREALTQLTRKIHGQDSSYQGKSS